ncbi:MAG: hypothetical protein ACFFD9_05945 [Candidatus Thorarchaeota archaeon]
MTFRKGSEREEDDTDKETQTNHNCFLGIFVLSLGFVPGMVQAYDNPDHR